MLLKSKLLFQLTTPSSVQYVGFELIPSRILQHHAASLQMYLTALDHTLVVVVVVNFPYFQPSSIEKDASTGKLTLKFNYRTEANGPESQGEITDADCVLMAVGRSPSTKNMGLEKLVCTS